MANGKNFNLFLMDGEATGRIKCTLANWTGIAYKIPRTYLEKCKERADLKQSGVYFLFGKNNQDEEQVYIGQADSRNNGNGVLSRIIEHLKDVEYFSDVVILTTQNNSFGKTEISYLENRFTSLAIDNARYTVINKNTPNGSNVTEEKESELEDFIENSKMILGVLGYKIFVSLIKKQVEIQSNKDQEELMLYISAKRKGADKPTKGQCKRTNEGFVVLAGSMIEDNYTESTPNSVRLLKEKYIENNEIIDGILQEDKLFSSPSYAASFVLGRSINGKELWKTKEGLSLNDLETKEME